MTRYSNFIYKYSFVKNLTYKQSAKEVSQNGLYLKYLEDEDNFTLLGQSLDEINVPILSKKLKKRKREQIKDKKRILKQLENKPTIKQIEFKKVILSFD